ncbi:MAG: amino acid permease [Planctomycetota bacterium]|nr:MAG: amino acid permease [Planctomycetota bacterium]
MAPPSPLESQPAPGKSQHDLLRVLGFYSVVAIVVGQVIGSGIFFKPQVVAQQTGGFVGLILALWIVCGLVNLCGALAMGELAAMFPRAGGTYVFLRETYGDLWSFLWAWAEFWVIRTGAIAALGAYFAVSLENVLYPSTSGSLYGMDLSGAGATYSQKAIAVAAIAGLGVISIIRTTWAGAVQNVATVIKAGFVAFLAVLPFIALQSDPVEMGPLWPEEVGGGMVLGIGAAVAAIMWAYDGWGNVTVVAEEVHKPHRNLPLGLIVGVVLLIALYAGANLAYHLTLPSSVIAAPDNTCPAIPVCEKLLPSFGAKLMRSMIMVSVFGALSSNVLVGPRVLFAVARDHSFLGRFARIHPITRTPAWAIAGMCAWSCALILMGGLSWEPDAQLFNLMSEWTVFGGSIFYFSAVAAVFVLRIRRPDAERPYRTWGYPIVPLVFLAFYAFLLVTMLLENPGHRLVGLGLISAGAIVYFAFAKRGQPEPDGDASTAQG